jgi:hypothetical protein
LKKWKRKKTISSSKSMTLKTSWCNSIKWISTLCLLTTFQEEAKEWYFPVSN